MTLGFSGLGPCGHPKVVPHALADLVESSAGEMPKYGFTLFVAASVSHAVEDRWARLGLTRTRWPFQSGRHTAALINSGKLNMGDSHLSVFAQELEFGFFTPDGLDIGIIEVTAITEDGGLVLTTWCSPRRLAWRPRWPTRSSTSSSS